MVSYPNSATGLTTICRKPRLIEFSQKIWFPEMINDVIVPRLSRDIGISDGFDSGCFNLEKREMVRKIGQVAVAMLVAAFGVSVSVGALVAQDKKELPSVKEIMKEGHSKKGLLGKIKAGVKEEKWDDIAKDAEKLKEFGVALGKNKPEKGDAESWTKLAAEYKKSTAAVAKSVAAKDQKGANAALGKIGSSCKSCHDSHK